MKKIACLLLAVLLMVVAGTALAESVGVSASYNETAKTLTVSTSADGYFIIFVDGAATDYSLTTSNKSYTFSIELGNGTHSVRIWDEENYNSGSTSFKVGPEATEVPAPTEAPVVPTEAPVIPTEVPVVPTEAPVEPTAAPVEPTEAPTGPVKFGSVSYDNGVISYSVNGLRGHAELWLDGSATGVSISANGSYSYNKELPVGTHTLTVFCPAYNEQDSRTIPVEVKKPEINASYTKVGVLNYNVSNLNTESEIWLDGSATGASVKTNGSYTLNVTLTEGNHTIMVFDPLNNVRGTATFTVDHIAQIVPGTPATCTENGLSDGEVCAICGKELKAQEVLPMIDHTPKTVPGKAATCTEAGLTDGEECAVCGKELKAQEAIPALGHAYQIVDRSNGRINYRCSRCGVGFYEIVKDNKNTYGSIVKDATGLDVDYTTNGNAKTKTLVITADLAKATTTELGLYLDTALIDQLKAEGYDTVEFVNDKATLVITLAEINPAWFDTNSAIWFYVFSTDPAVEGTLVKVEAQISGTDKVPATSYTGVELKK